MDERYEMDTVKKIYDTTTNTYLWIGNDPDGGNSIVLISFDDKNKEVSRIYVYKEEIPYVLEALRCFM